MCTVLVAALSISLILWTVVRGQTIYEPEDGATDELFMQRRCVNTLEHPPHTTVQLFQYNISEFGESFFLVFTNVTNTDNHTEDCADNVVDPSNLTGIIRSTMFIFELETCHDVLFFSGSNPVVCLYYLNPLASPATTRNVLAILVSLCAFVSVLS